MLPFSKSSSQDMISRKPKSSIIHFKKSLISYLKSHVSFCKNYAWVPIILLVQILIIRAFTSTTIRSAASTSPPPIPTTSHQFSSIDLRIQPRHHNPPPPPPAEQCKYGKVYVYDLPPMFNKDLLDNCQDLDPRRSLCAAVSNNGFGPRAATLAGVIPQELTPPLYWTDLFSGEIIFHTRFLNYKCRTMKPESAAAFYVPFYAGLAVSKYLFTLNSSSRDRDAPCEKFLHWIKDQTYWRRSNGSDHFLMLGRSSYDFRRTHYEDNWGTSFLLMPLMKQMFRLTIERNFGDPMEVSVPYPAEFHPRKLSEIAQWQEFVRTRNRSSLFTFVGGKRDSIKNDFRALLLDHCSNESDSCRVVDCAKTPCLDGSSAVIEAFLNSNFCLQPRGDSVTRRAVFDCMLAGSIPVFFWEGTVGGQYEQFMSDKPESFSVFLHRDEVRNGTSIRKVLERYSQEDIKRMRDNVIDCIPRISYAISGEELGNFKDAFDIGVEEVLRRIASQKAKNFS